MGSRALNKQERLPEKENPYPIKIKVLKLLRKSWIPLASVKSREKGRLRSPGSGRSSRGSAGPLCPEAPARSFPEVLLRMSETRGPQSNHSWLGRM